jgi:hypothetical protein
MPILKSSLFFYFRQADPMLVRAVKIYLTLTSTFAIQCPYCKTETVCTIYRYSDTVYPNVSRLQHNVYLLRYAPNHGIVTLSL